RGIYRLNKGCSATPKYGERNSIKAYILPIIIILATFIWTEATIIRTIQSHYYRLLEKQSTQFALSYAQNINKAAQASRVINELLEDKLLTASKTLALYDQRVEEASLADLADSLGLDDIYYYNSAGEIISSNKGHYIGWTAYPGHPVHDFILGGQRLLVEEIRADTESGELNKYAYILLDDGFVQIGIKAARVEAFLSAFDSNRLLGEMAEPELVDAIYFLDPDLVVRGSSKPDFTGLEVNRPEIIQAIENDQTYAVSSFLDQKEVYQVYTPVYASGSKIGTLVVAQSLEETRAIIRKASVLGTITVIVVFISLLLVLYFSYSKNRGLQKKAFFHTLSALPNRIYLDSVLQTDLKRDPTEKKALCLIHCQNFAAINHVFGFQFGDRILKELGQKLEAAFRNRHALFHFSVNRYALYITGYKNKKELAELAKEAMGILRTVFDIRGLEQYVTIKAGIVEINERYPDTGQIFTNASLAILHAGDDEQTPSFFSPKMAAKPLREDFIEKELRAFLARPDSGILHLEYQPVVDLKTNRIVAFEALARMQSKDVGSVDPVEFIDIAERKRLIVPLGAWVLETACRFLQKLEALRYNSIRIAVNISGKELGDNFPQKVSSVLEKYRVNPNNLVLEITENIMLRNFSEINAMFQEIRALGVRIAIDDFGTGYSSFARLGELNVDIIKIDKHFVDQVPQKEQGKLVFGELIAMGHKLGLKVIAEGVETEIQRQYLIAKGCELMQGYFYSRSLSPKEAVEKLRASEIAAQ
ncbi:MAG: EAL domain-containing protein, partial [Firmicutes bacterium]|nr:EAL domain-containing protein [Bacillota bacterium]